jgi:signal transduction histidine kinase
VLADEKLLRQILANLLSNAAKYSAPGSPIRLDVAEEGKQILFRVADEGMGIPEEDRPHLFEEFHRGANAVNMRGTGLGLAIAKKAADLHRGTIEFESELGRGTTFTVRLPARRPAGSAR